jgi:hypothetical protein
MPVIGPQLDEDFLAIVCADEGLLRAEFDAIIAAAWPGPGAGGRRRPSARRPGPGGRPRRATAAAEPPGVRLWVPATPARERSPPWCAW